MIFHQKEKQLRANYLSKVCWSSKRWLYKERDMIFATDFHILFCFIFQISYANVLYDCPEGGPEIWRGKNNGIPPARTFHLAHEVIHLK